MERKVMISAFIIALLELAFSQVHIAAITMVYSSTIGIYLFGFIVCGLILMMQIMKIQDMHPRYFTSILSSISCLVFGVVYLTMLISDQEVVEHGLSSIRGSLILVALGLIGYLIILVVTVKLSNLERKKGKNGKIINKYANN